MHQSDLLRQRVAADITSQFKPGTFNLSVDQLSVCLGLHPAHIRNQLSKGLFPVQSVLIGSRRLFPLTNVIEYLAGLVVAQQKPAKPAMGRPTKASLRIRSASQQAGVQS